MSSKPDQENDRLLSATATPDGVTGDIGKVCPSTTQKLQSGQKPFVTPAKATPAAKSAVFSALNTPILCPTYGNPIPHQVLAQALKEGHQIRSFFPGGLNSTPAALDSNGNTGFTHSELQSAVAYTGSNPAGYFSSGSAPKSHAPPTSSSKDPVHLTSSPSTSNSPPPARIIKGQAAQARPASTGGKASSAPARVQAPQRNPKDWDPVKDKALLLEVVEGEIFIMMKAKGAKRETLQQVKRSEGIPHGKTTQYWEKIIENMDKKEHWRLLDDGSTVSLFGKELKVDYVKARFEKLVTDHASKVKRLQERKPSNSNDDDFSKVKGDDSEPENGDAPSEDDTADKSDATVQNNNSLLDAYLAQVQAFERNEFDGGEVFGAATSAGAKRAFGAATSAGAKRASGQDGEEVDEELIEKNANKTSKLPKLPKLPGQTIAERSQSQTLDHQSRMGSGFEALAKAQAPSTVEDFSAKVSSVASIVSTAFSSTFSGTVKAYYEGQKAARSCVNDSGHEFSHVAGTSPPVILCKNCGMRP